MWRDVWHAGWRAHDIHQGGKGVPVTTGEADVGEVKAHMQGADTLNLAKLHCDEKYLGRSVSLLMLILLML